MNTSSGLVADSGWDDDLLSVRPRSLGYGCLVPHAHEIAVRAHRDQTDKAGRPYITHPARIVAKLARQGLAEEYLAVAWLHDVIEDSPFTVADLLAHGFPLSVIVAVEAITLLPDERPEPYYHRVARNSLALSVKYADIDDNSDPGRLALLARTDPDTAERLAAKYAKARAALAGFAAENGVVAAYRSVTAAE